MRPELPSETVTYVILGHMDETVASRDCKRLREVGIADLGRTETRMTIDFLILETKFPPASEIVRLIEGGLWPGTTPVDDLLAIDVAKSTAGGP